MSGGQELLVMKTDEVERYQAIRKALDKVTTQKEAAEFLDLSPRQVRRIIRRVRGEGSKGVIHRLRGQSGSHHLPEDLKARVLSLYREHYPDFGPTLASEKLKERNKVSVNDETLRRWLIQAGLRKRRRHSEPKEFLWRKRKDRLGEMVQMDGSHHDWLEGRGPRLVLIGYIDDATGRAFGRFYDYEGTVPAMKSIKDYMQINGIPMTIYLDKHSTYKMNRKEGYTDSPFKDKQELTQFGRACKQLGIRLIFAHTPQAKGRVERGFKTHQDRLVKELRLQKADTCRQANQVLAKKYLNEFNGKFELIPAKKGDLHRKLDRRMKLDEILSIHIPHVLRNDGTIVHLNKWYQVTSRTRSNKMVVHEHLDGKLSIRNGSHPVTYKPIPGPVIRPKPILTTVVGRSRKSRPVPAGRNSYWRKSFDKLFIKSNYELS